MQGICELIVRGYSVTRFDPSKLETCASAQTASQRECLNAFCVPNTGSAGNQKVLKMYIGGGALLLIIILAVLFLR